jgi:hypothetical protein
MDLVMLSSYNGGDVSPALVILVCILIAIVIVTIIMLGSRSKLKSVTAKRAACDYVRTNSFRLTNQSDAFLYNNITKKPIPRSNNQSSSGGSRRR